MNRLFFFFLNRERTFSICVPNLFINNVIKENDLVRMFIGKADQTVMIFLDELFFFFYYFK